VRRPRTDCASPRYGLLPHTHSRGSTLANTSDRERGDSEEEEEEEEERLGESDRDRRDRDDSRAELADTHSDNPLTAGPSSR
jgi:hypothetical protein